MGSRSKKQEEEDHPGKGERKDTNETNFMLFDEMNPMINGFVCIPDSWSPDSQMMEEYVRHLYIINEESASHCQARETLFIPFFSLTCLPLLLIILILLLLGREKTKVGDDSSTSLILSSSTHSTHHRHPTSNIHTCLLLVNRSILMLLKKQGI